MRTRQAKHTRPPERAVHSGWCQHGDHVDARTLNLTLDFCLRVGELLLSSGAGAADVTATMQSAGLAARGPATPTIDVTFTVAVDELPAATRRSRR